MSQTKPWVKALKISFNDYEAWSTEVTSEESLTFWALDKGKIKAQDYLHWAREHYQLPVLKDSWFKKHCNHKLWNQIQSVANWSPHMIPIEEWDGIIYVAVVEPPEGVQWSFPVTYVLAHARPLKNHWKALQSGDHELPPIPESILVNTSSTADTPNEEGEVDHLASIEIPDAETTALPPTGEFIQQQEGEGPTAPEIHLNIPEPNEIISDEGGGDIKIPMDLELSLPKATAIPDSPEGISLDFPNNTVASKSSPEGISLDLPDPTQQDSHPDGVSLDIPKFDRVPDDVASLDDTLDSLGIKKEPEFKLKFDIGEDSPNTSPPEPTHLTNATHTNKGTITRFAITVTGLNKEAPKGAVIDTDKSAPHTSSSCANESEAAAWLFNELKCYFQQSMILLLNGEELKPWKWENSWSPKSKEAFEGFNPDQPGLFRIIKRTKQPYHGYVVSSSLNKAFFKNWGFETFPEHVTALPMIVEGHLTGIVLSLGDKASASDRALIDSDKMVNEFVNTIIRLTSKAA